MENEVLELWAAKRKAVLFITHDLDEAIAMSDRVVVLSAGPAHASDRRIRDRPAASARRRRNPHASALRRAARADLGRAARRSAEGLRAAAEAGGLTMWNTSRPSQRTCVSGRSLLLAACCFVLWHVLTQPTLLPPFYLRRADQVPRFFFGEPLKVGCSAIWRVVRRPATSTRICG